MCLEKKKKNPSEAKEHVANNKTDLSNKKDRAGCQCWGRK